MLRFIYHLNPFTNQSHQDFNEFNAFRIGAESIGIVSNYNATTKPIRQNSFAFLRDAPKILRILVNPFSIFLFSFAIFFIATNPIVIISFLTIEFFLYKYLRRNLIENYMGDSSDWSWIQKLVLFFKCTLITLFHLPLSFLPVLSSCVFRISMNEKFQSKIFTKEYFDKYYNQF